MVERNRNTTQAEPRATRRIQVNTDLFDEVADAFERYRDSSGVGLNAPALRALIIPRLRELGFLHSDIAIEPQSAKCN